MSNIKKITTEKGILNCITYDAEHVSCLEIASYLILCMIDNSTVDLEVKILDIK